MPFITLLIPSFNKITLKFIIYLHFSTVFFVPSLRTLWLIFISIMIKKFIFIKLPSLTLSTQNDLELFYLLFFTLFIHFTHRLSNHQLSLITYLLLPIPYHLSLITYHLSLITSSPRHSTLLFTLSPILL